MFQGSFVALLTPFKSDGSIDELSFEQHIEWQLSEGTTGLVPVGTTGESATLSHEEHKRVIEVCVKVADGRAPVLAGAGSNNTTEAVELAIHAENLGADAVLVVTPYYNRPTQDGLFAHFAAVAEAVSLPLYIYNIPSRSAVDMTSETMGALVSTYSNIAGVKDATGKIERVSEQRIFCGHEFRQFSGEDATALAFNAHGGIGCISVTANVAPKLCSQFQKRCLDGNFVAALELNDLLAPLHRAIFLEPGVCGSKYALSRLGRMSRTVRSPLLPSLSTETEQQIDEALLHAGLFS